MKRIALLCLGAAVLVSCQDSEPTRPPEAGLVSLAISDGAHGGNPEFFFFPPLVGNPRSNPDFGDNDFNPDLAPFVRICELDIGEPSPGPDDPPVTPNCVVDGEGEDIVVGPDLPMLADAANEFYKVNWETTGFGSEDGLDNNKNYRIQVMIGTNTLIGYRDVDPDPGPPVGSCTDEPFCQFNNGSMIPIRARIEAAAFCPPGVSCQTKTTNFGEEERWEIEGNSFYALNVPAQPGSNGPVTITFQECEPGDDVDDLIDLPTYGPCVETDILTDEFDGTLHPDATATISFCNIDMSTWTPSPPPSQADLIRVHAFHDDGSIEALREAAICPALTSLPSNPVLRLASRIRDRVGSWIGVRPLIAGVVAGPTSRGGDSEETIRTRFKFALPAKIDFEDAADASRIAPVGSQLTTRAAVTDLRGNGVAGAKVRWNVAEVGELGAEVEGGLNSSPGCAAGSTDDLVCTTSSTGTVEVLWELADDPGLNVLTAGGRGIADPRELFNGPRGETAHQYLYGSFDPFIPIMWNETDPSGEQVNDGISYPEDEGAELIPTGTRLLFSATGCSAIEIDGVKSVDEWGCAATETFTANVSGGRQTATFFWTRFEGDVYFAVQVPVVTAAEKEIKLTLYLNGDESGTFQSLDDVLVVDGTVDQGEPQFSDEYLWDRCPKGKSFCALVDLEGPDLGEGMFSINAPEGEEAFYFFEVRQSENADNVYDIDGTSHLGVSLTLRIGKGRWGNTEWPAFGVYEALY